MDDQDLNTGEQQVIRMMDRSYSRQRFLWNAGVGTYCFLQAASVGVVWGGVPEDLFQQQGVFDQTGARDVKKAPQVQLPAERRLEAALQEVLHPPVLLLLVQQGLGCQLVAAVFLVGVESG